MTDLLEEEKDLSPIRKRNLRVKTDELKYEFTVSERTWLIRWYRLIWGQNARMTFCALFWGTLLSVPTAFAIVVANVFAIWPVKALMRFGRTVKLIHTTRKTIARERRQIKALLPKPKKPQQDLLPRKRPVLTPLRIARYAGKRVVTTFIVKPRIAHQERVAYRATLKKIRRLNELNRSLGKKPIPIPPPTRRDKALDFVALVGSYMVVKLADGLCKVIDGADWFLSKAKRPFIYTVKCSGLALAVTAFGVGGGFLVNLILHLSGAVWAIIGYTVAGGMFGVVLGGFVYLAHRAKVDAVLGRALAAVTIAIAYTVAIGAKIVHAKSLQAFIFSYRAVKTNTCPRIVLEEEVNK